MGLSPSASPTDTKFLAGLGMEKPLAKTRHSVKFLSYEGLERFSTQEGSTDKHPSVWLRAGGFQQFGKVFDDATQVQGADGVLDSHGFSARSPGGK